MDATRPTIVWPTGDELPRPGNPQDPRTIRGSLRTVQRDHVPFSSGLSLYLCNRVLEILDQLFGNTDRQPLDKSRQNCNHAIEMNAEMRIIFCLVTHGSQMLHMCRAREAPDRRRSGFVEAGVLPTEPEKCSP